MPLETGKLLTLSQKREARPGPRAAAAVVELVDGSLIQANQYVVRGSQAQITLAGGEIVEAPTSAVRTVQFQPSAEFSSEWSRLLEAKADSDLLIVRTDGSLDAHKGVLHDVTEDAVRFDLDGEILPVRRSKVYGLAYRHSVAAELPPAICRITDSAGSQWSVRSLVACREAAMGHAGRAGRVAAAGERRRDRLFRRQAGLLERPEAGVQRLDAVVRRREAVAGGQTVLRPALRPRLRLGRAGVGGRPLRQGLGAARPHRTRLSSAGGVPPLRSPRPASTTPRGPAARSGWSSAATTRCCGKAKSPAAMRPRRSNWTLRGSGV